MNDEDRDSLFLELSGLMKDKGLGWAASQVAEAIRFGYLEGKRVKASAVDVSEPGVGLIVRKGREKKQDFPATREFHSPERLGLLLDALERAVVSVSTMESKIAKDIKKLAPNVVRIVLVREDRVRELPLGDQADRAEAARLIKNLIAKIRELN